MIKLRLLVASFERKVSFCSFQIVQTEPTEWNAGLSAHAQTTYHVTLCLENVSVLLAKQE